MDQLLKKTIKGKKDDDVHVFYLYVHTNYFNKQFFVVGDILCQLPKTGAGTWLNALVSILKQPPAGMSFKQRAVIFHIDQ